MRNIEIRTFRKKTQVTDFHNYARYFFREKKYDFHKKYRFESSQLSTLLFTFMLSWCIHVLTHTINEMQKFCFIMFRTLGEVDVLTLYDVSVLTLLRFETLRFDTLTLSDTTLLCYAVFCRSTK